MQEVDRRAAEVYGLPTPALMENAGRAVALRADALLGGARGRRVVVVCGGGNNGGDGLVAARHLANWGARVRVVMACEGWPTAPKLSADAGVQLHVVTRCGIEVLGVDPDGRRRVELALTGADLVVDAVLGTGSRGAPRGAAMVAVELMQAARARILAVDIPTGLDADSGHVPGPAVQAEETVTFGLPKPAHVLLPAAGLCGRVRVADIGFPAPLLEQAPAAFELLEAARVSAMLPARPAAGHKGTFGHVLVVAGSRGMTGAGALASRGALAAGAGLVTWALPASVQPVGAQLVAEALTASLPDEGEGQLAEAAGEQVLQLLQTRDVLVLGPGLGTGAGVSRVVARLVAEARCPAVVDADAINVLAGQREVLERAGRLGRGGRSGEAPRLVLTPHPGEMARLLGSDVPSVQQDRLGVALGAARRFGAVVVLKGARTVIASPDGRVSVNPAALPALATGGSGDVLSGIIGGLLAQGLDPYEAACAGVFVHALAGAVAAGDPEGPALAGQVAACVPEAFRRLRRRDPVPEVLEPVTCLR